MRWDRVHVGQHRQGPMSPEEIEAAEKAEITPGINPDLHAPEIQLPGDTVETNLHGDIEGSPYSAEPGKMSLAEAADKDAEGAAAQAAADRADTRAREAESRRTGTPTETLAAEDEGDKPEPRRSKK